MTSPDATLPREPVRVRLLVVPGCPFAAQVRATLRECLREDSTPAVVEDVEGPYPSPTLLVDGVDVVTGRAPDDSACCRLDLPTRTDILNALRRYRS